MFKYNFWKRLKEQLGYDCVVANVCSSQKPPSALVWTNLHPGDPPLRANVIYERPLTQSQFDFLYCVSYYGMMIILANIYHGPQVPPSNSSVPHI